MTPVPVLFNQDVSFHSHLRHKFFSPQNVIHYFKNTNLKRAAGMELICRLGHLSVNTLETCSSDW